MLVWQGYKLSQIIIKREVVWMKEYSKRNSRKAKKKTLSEQNGFHPPSGTTIAVIAGFLILMLAVTVPLNIYRHNRNIRKYSGAPVDRNEQLNFDVSVLEEFSDQGVVMNPDGTYSRHIVLKKDVDLRLWRDRERPRLPLKEQISEKYPGLEHFQSKEIKASGHLSEKCGFVSDERSHTAAIIRRVGWDYLIDLSVAAEGQSRYADYIDSVLDSIFFL